MKVLLFLLFLFLFPSRPTQSVCSWLSWSGPVYHTSWLLEGKPRFQFTFCLLLLRSEEADKFLTKVLFLQFLFLGVLFFLAKRLFDLPLPAKTFMKCAWPLTMPLLVAVHFEKDSYADDWKLLWWCCGMNNTRAWDLEWFSSGEGLTFLHFMSIILTNRIK